uniref:Potassium channel toxin-like alpha-KTx 10.3 n=1 Tax=Mesobuthus gibbosus TaxID=123226 RepID=A0A059UD51_MESGB|nr:potassium channel toxin-like alpha-KTx 10.3 [Mesobuthus gibbosus]
MKRFSKIICYVLILTLMTVIFSDTLVDAVDCDVDECDTECKARGYSKGTCHDFNDIGCKCHKYS